MNLNSSPNYFTIAKMKRTVNTTEELFCIDRYRQAITARLAIRKQVLFQKQYIDILQVIKTLVSKTINLEQKPVTWS